MDEAVARERLEAILAGLDSSVATLVAEHPEDTDALSTVDQHPADAATDLSDAERESALIGLAEEQRRTVLAALERLDRGSYGRCVDCGRPVPPERLEARPEAARCLEDQARFERAS